MNKLSEGETCQCCKRSYTYVWRVSDDIWQKVADKNENGLYCIECFDEMARQKNIFLYWEPNEGDWKINES